MADLAVPFIDHVTVIVIVSLCDLNVSSSSDIGYILSTMRIYATTLLVLGLYKKHTLYGFMFSENVMSNFADSSHTETMFASNSGA